MIRHWFQHISIFAVFGLIFALSLNGPRPTCSLNASSSTISAQNTNLGESAPGQDSSSEEDEKSSSQAQNNANSYEEIHDEMVIAPPHLSKPYYSYFVPASDTFLHGISNEEHQRPPRS